MRCLTRWLGIGVALGLSAVHTIPVDAPVVDRVLVDQALREQLVARGTQDEHFCTRCSINSDKDLTGIGSSLGSWPTPPPPDARASHVPGTGDAPRVSGVAHRATADADAGAIAVQCSGNVLRVEKGLAGDKG